MPSRWTTWRGPRKTLTAVCNPRPDAEGDGAQGGPDAPEPEAEATWVIVSEIFQQDLLTEPASLRVDR